MSEPRVSDEEIERWLRRKSKNVSPVTYRELLEDLQACRAELMEMVMAVRRVHGGDFPPPTSLAVRARYITKKYGW